MGYKIKLVIVGMLIALSLTGCSLFSPVKTQPSTTYMLNKTPQVSIRKPRRAMNVLVMQPEAYLPYNTTDMAYVVAPYRLDYFAKNKWVIPPAQMLQPLLIQTLQNTHYFRVVISPPALGYYDYVLRSQLLKLEQEFFAEQNSQVRLMMNVQLINAKNGRIIATKQFSVVEKACPDTPYGGVIAANRATARLLKQIARFCLTRVS